MDVGLQAILDAREARWLRRLELCRRGTLLTLTMNVPGPDKNPARWNNAHRTITAILTDDLRGHLLHFEERETPAGAESCFVTDLPADGLKQYAVDMEETHPIGRLLDLDVMDREGTPVGRETLGLPPRLCLCCDREGRECARERRHSLAQLFSKADGLLDSWDARTNREGRIT